MQSPDLRAILGWLTFTVAAGQISIDLSPDQMPRTGQRMSLVCRVSQGDHVTPACLMFWSLTPFNNNNNNNNNNGLGQERPLETSGQVKLLRYVNRNRTPVKSQLTIRNMTSAYAGQYTCSLMCPNTKESAAILIHIRTGFFDSSPSRSQLLGTLIPVVAVIVLLAISFIMALRRGNRVSQVTEPDEFVFPNGGSQEDLIGPTVADPPPRYSWLVPIDGSAENMGVDAAYVETEVGSVGGDTVQTPPPDYTQAVLDLAEKGIILNPENLRPQPPAYTES